VVASAPTKTDAVTPPAAIKGIFMRLAPFSTLGAINP
jgi:hypothetical protein